MAYTYTVDFKFGLDRRRPLSAIPAGSLYTLTNGHITRGGDIEKRKAFVSTYALPVGATFGLQETADGLVVFGHLPAPAVPAGITYQKLLHPDGLSMTALLSSDLFDGKIYAIAEYSDGSVHHFYDGTRVADWDNGIVRTAMVDNDGIASHLAALIQADTAYTTTVATNVITIEAAVAGTPFTISANTVNKTGGTDNQSVSLVQTVANIAGIAEVLATASFTVTGGTSSPGVNYFDVLTVDGVDILGGNVDWAISNSGTATNIAAQINSNVSVPDYTAVANGPVVTISAAAGTGAGPNGFVVVAAGAGNVTVGSVSPTMTGGVTAVTGQKQKYTATIGGTFEVGDRFTITIDGKKFGADGNPLVKGRLCLTNKSKVYTVGESLLEFSAARDATLHNSDDDAGAGNINMASHDAGSAALTGLEVYQSNLAVFARSVVQVWSVDADETLNVQLQVLRRTGTRAPKSILSYNDTDTFYLADNGLRSLRAKDSSNTAFVNDIGTPIDKLVIDDVAALADAVVEAACSTVEPLDGRYWLALGTKIYVLSYFPGSKISAWSTYEPGFTIDHFAVYNSRVYARSGNTIYLYGGSDNATYDSSVVTVQMPFLTSDRPATHKQIEGIDVDLEGTWTTTLLVDPRDEDQHIRIGDLTGYTYNAGGVYAIGDVTAFAPKFVSSGSGYHRISSVAVHFAKANEKS